MEHWGYLLSHGEFYDYYWKPEDMTKEQAQQMLNILEEYGDAGWSGLYSDLKRRMTSLTQKNSPLK